MVANATIELAGIVAKVQKNQKIAISSVVIDRAWNVREADDTTYKVDALRDDIALQGQTHVATLEKIKQVDGSVAYRPIRGFLRSTAIKELAEQKVIDPLTMKRDDKTGELIPGTGKPFENILADVYEDLTDKERTALLIDHGQRRGLRIWELFYAMERLFQANESEITIATTLRSLLEELYPPNKVIEPGAANVLNYYRGVIQTAKEAWRGPKLMRDAWVEKLKGLHSWPTKKEMMDGVKIYKKEADADKLMKINRDNPGKLFMDYWSRLLKAQEEAEANGPNEAKKVSMMTRSQLEDTLTLMDSRIAKALYSVALNNAKVSRSSLPTLDTLLLEFEAGMTDAQKQVLDSVFTFAETAVEAEEVKTEEKVA